MSIEQVRARNQLKPWGVSDLRPWSSGHSESSLIGEISYERADSQSTPPALLLKLLFTSAPLSIQVHPDDAFAKLMGLPNGKTEAWYILSATHGARVALGLKQAMTPQQLRRAAEDGSMAELMDWRLVKAHDVISVPAGTIHAIGAGIVLAEIQQRSDATYRLFDFARERPLNIQDGTAGAMRGPAEPQFQPKRLSDERTLLVANSHFGFERICLAAGSTWCLDAERETWLLVLEGSANVGSFDLTKGGAVLAQSQRVDIRAGNAGMECLVAYPGLDGPAPQLLRPIAQQNLAKRLHPGTVEVAEILIRTAQ